MKTTKCNHVGNWFTISYTSKLEDDMVYLNIKCKNCAAPGEIKVPILSIYWSNSAKVVTDNGISGEEPHDFYVDTYRRMVKDEL